MAKLPQVSTNTVLTHKNPRSSAGAPATSWIRFWGDRPAHSTFGRRIFRAAGGNDSPRSPAPTRSPARPTGRWQVCPNPYWGKRADAWERESAQAFAARMTTDMRVKGAEFAPRQANGDPTLFEKCWQGFRSILNGVPEAARCGPMEAEYERVGAQYHGAAPSTRRETAESRANANYMNARAEQLGADLLTLARTGGTGSKEFQTSLEQLKSLRSGR